nr:MAG: hypothetical protein DIU78_26440 [Pseudomonadota bacterium]
MRNFWASSIDAAARSRYDNQCPSHAERIATLAVSLVHRARRTLLATKHVSGSEDDSIGVGVTGGPVTSGTQDGEGALGFPPRVR